MTGDCTVYLNKPKYIESEKLNVILVDYGFVPHAYLKRHSTVKLSSNVKK